MKHSSVIVYAGPSGGHLFPAQAFSECLKQRKPDCNIYLVTSKRAINIVGNDSEKTFTKIYYLPEFGMSSAFSSKTLKACFLLPLAFLISTVHLLKVKPRFCVGFGSFVSFPGIKIASLLKIPTIIHEQNKVPGKATKWLISCVNKICVSFKKTNLGENQKISFTGFPIRRSIKNEIEAKVPFKEKLRLKLLVLGGSQGSSRLNDIFIDAIRILPNEERKKIDVIHITGKRDFERVEAAYKGLNVSCDIYPFSEKMGKVYSLTDFAITRGGAGTLFELSIFGIPSLVIPYPYAEAHQKQNTDYFENVGAVLSHSEDMDASPWIAENLKVLLGNREKWDKMSRNIKKLAVFDGSEKLVSLAETFIT